MIRYCKQLNKSDCGPIAVLNALKWAGEPVSIRKNYKEIRDNCFWIPRIGTESFDLQSFLDRWDSIATSRVWSYTLKALDSSLKQGKTLILLYTFRRKDKDQGHFIFIHGQDKNGYFIYNDYDNNKEHCSYITRKEMKKRLSYRIRDGKSWDPRIIEITKK